MLMMSILQVARDPIFFGFEYLSHFSSHYILGDSLYSIILSHESSSHIAPATTAHDIYISLTLKVKQHHVLYDHLIVGLKQIQGGKNQFIAQSVTKMALTPSTISFLVRNKQQLFKTPPNFFGVLVIEIQCQMKSFFYCVMLCQ